MNIRNEARLTWAAWLGGLLLAGQALAAPTGGQVTAGQGSIAQTGSATIITQNTGKLAIDWQSFNIGQGESVTFQQPSASAIALNRILGHSASEIYGKLNANGQVFLLNPNGVLFGKNAQVNVGGIVASTLKLSDTDFLSGHYQFSGASTASVSNEGSINAAQGGYVALLGASVSNSGTISAELGKVSLAAGQQITLQLDNGSLLCLTVDKGAVKALADNGGLIQTQGGQTLLTAQAADALTTAVVNNTGIIEAHSLANHNGTIELLGDMHTGTVNVGGTLDASATPDIIAAPDRHSRESGNPASSGSVDGGLIETSAAQVKIADKASITTQGANGGSNGTWLIDPYDFTIAASGGDITGSALSAALGSNDVVIQTSDTAATCTNATCGAGTSGNGDILVNDALSWSSDKTLTLDAYRDINLNAAINAPSGNLSLRAGGSITQTGGALTVGGITNITSHGNVTLNNANNDFNTVNVNSNGGAVALTDMNALTLGSLLTGDLNINTNGALTFGNDASVIGNLTLNVAGNITQTGGGLAVAGTTAISSTGDITLTSIANIFNGNANINTSGAVNLASSNNLSLGTVSANSLTLNATGNISASGTVSLGHFILNSGNWSQTGSSLPAFSATDFTLNGGSFVRALGGDGSSASPYQLTDVFGLQGISTLLDQHFVLANDIDASATQNWSGGAGFVPIGDGTPSRTGIISYGNGFTGSLDGLGHSISQLTINASNRQGVGLFEQLGAGSSVQNLGIVDGAITTDANATDVGLLAGYSFASLSHVWVSGSVTVSGVGAAGGLVGRTGYGSGDISDASAQVRVDGGAHAGGLVGWTNGNGGSSISRSWASGDVNGGEAGGLVGLNNASISQSWASGNVNGGTTAGGLTGSGGGSISQSWASGDVIGSFAGGLVGKNSGSISDSYATGSVTGSIRAGGLIANNTGPLDNVYALGAVGGSGNTAGLVFKNDYESRTFTITNAWWATDTTGQSVGVAINVNPDDTIDATGLPLADLIAALPASFDASVWGNGGNLTTPYLSALDHNSVYSVNDHGNRYDVVQTLDQLQAVNDNLAANYVLVNDLDASATQGWNSGAGFVPLGNQGAPFAGIFDGLGHVITGLTINRSAQNYVGLFGVSSGTIQRLGLAGGSVTGGNLVGALVGQNTGTLTLVYSGNKVAGNNSIGGLAGATTGIISNSYATGAVSGNNIVGGLLGDGGEYSRVENSYATGVVSGNDVVGGLAGSDPGQVSNSYWNTDTTGQTVSGGGTGKTSAELMTQATFNGWDFSNTWAMVAGQSYPYFQWQFSGTPDVLSGTVYTAVGGGNAGAGISVNGQIDGSDIAAMSTAANGSFYQMLAPGTLDNSTLLLKADNNAIHYADGASSATALDLYGDTFSASTSAASLSELDARLDGINASSAVAALANWNLLATGAFSFDAPFTLSGNLDLAASGALTATDSLSVARFALHAGDWSQVGSLPAFSASDFSLDLGSSFIRALDGDGSSANPYQLTDLFGLQGMGTLLDKNFVLANDIDASATQNWNGGAGFVPVGYQSRDSSSLDRPFTGSLNGQNHTISGLTINRSMRTAGLFGFSSGGVISHLGLLDVAVSGNANSMGALIGYMAGGSVTDVYATGSVSNFDNVGGLVGWMDGGSISTSHADVAVTTSGNNNAGGLVGSALNASLTDVYATGDVVGTNYAGGLVGTADTVSILRAFASGKVSAISNAGGLVGNLTASSSLADSYATGDVAITQDNRIPNKAGGLVGINAGSISNSYATGYVSSVATDDYVGGLVGNNGGGITSSYWNSDVMAAGVGNNAGTDTSVGLSSADMMKAGSFSGWDLSAQGGDSTTWRIYEGNTAPLLRTFLAPYTVTATPDYDGTQTSFANIGSVTVTGDLSDSHILGSGLSGGDTLTLTSTVAGGYTATSNASLDIYSDQLGYDLSVNNAGRRISTPGSAAGEVQLPNSLSWSSGTLIIDTSGAVTTLGAGGSNTTAINGAGFVLANGVWSQIGSLPAFAVTDFTLNGGTFLRALGGDGSSASPYQLTDLFGLQGMGTLLDKNFVLANDIDASATQHWNGGAGFVPLGYLSGSSSSLNRPFTGSLDGQNHTISGLTINQSVPAVGLFGWSSGGAISHLGLLDVTVSGSADMGALIGYMTGGSVTDVYATGSVSNTGNTGGLVGNMDGGSIRASHADVAITTAGRAGGLVGNLIGGGSLTDVYATGNVAGGNSAGGLVGAVDGSSISRAFASGSVSGTYTAGGLIGGLSNASTLADSYATGDVAITVDNRSVNHAGGLVGINSGSISNSYATGYVSSVATDDLVGGLVGYNYGLGSTITSSYWNSDVMAAGVGGNDGTDNSVGLSSADLMKASSFAGWSLSAQGGDGTTWRIYEGHTTPLLRTFLAPFTVTATPDYDGSGAALANIGSVTVASDSHILGAASISGGDTLTLSSTAAGGYTATSNANVSGLYSDQLGYDLSVGAPSRSISTPGSAAGDIQLPDNLSWTSGTLIIDTSGQVSADNTLVNGAAFVLANGQWQQLNSHLPAFAVTDFTLNGGSFLRALDGDGDSANPYQLADVYGLQGMGRLLDKNFVLANDIDASATSSWHGGAGFAPIGSDVAAFSGSLDGQGHVIRQLYIHSPLTSYQGLFGNISGAASQLGVTGSVTGNQFVGGLAGQSTGTLANVWFDGQVGGSNEVGGLIGQMDGGNLSASWAGGTVTGSYQWIGGLVGYNLGTLTDVYATARVTGYDVVGALVGIMPTGSLTHGYALGSASATNGTTVGGLIGKLSNSGSVSQSYWATDINTTGVGEDANGGGAGATGVTLAGLMAALPAGFDASVWGNGAGANGQGQTTPYLTALAHNAVYTVNDSTRLYEVIQNLDQLQAVNNDLGGNYVLGKDIDASASAGWTGGFAPLGSDASHAFTGRFDGLHHAIHDLSIDTTASYVGLFGYTSSSAVLSGIGLDGGSIKGYAAAGADGVDDASGGNGGAGGDVAIGALVGENHGSVTQSYASATVAGFGGAGGMGGNATPDTLGDGGNGGVGGRVMAGGLIGVNRGSLNESYASGQVTGTAGMGGNGGRGSTTDSAPYGGNGGAGGVGGQALTGALVGDNQGTIDNSYATGQVTALGGNAGNGGAGGASHLQGGGGGNGGVGGEALAGGLTASNDGQIATSYASGQVIATGGQAGAGGAGGAGGTVANAGNDGFAGIDGQTQTGGLVGRASGSTSDSYWDTDTSGQGSSAGGTGKTSAELMQAATFGSWDISANGGDATVWRLYEGHTAPLLRSLLTPVTAILGNTTVTYNGSDQAAANVAWSATPDTSHVQGSFLSGSAVNVGLYTFDGSGVWSDQQGYDITVSGSGSLTIDPADITVSTSNVTKTYDGTTSAVGELVITSGQLFGSDKLSGGNFAFTNKNASSGDKVVIVSGASVSDGNNGGNYRVSYIANTTSTINKADATVTANSAEVDYNGQTQSVTGFTATGLVNGETESVLTGVTESGGAGRNAGSYDHTLSGTDANYNLTFVDGALTIDPLAITGIISADNKTYDGTNTASVHGSLSGVLGSDDVKLLASGHFASSNAGPGSVSIAASLAGKDAGNYSLSTNIDAYASIDKASATVTANSATVSYNGQTQSVTGFTATGLVNGETEAVLTGVSESGGAGLNVGSYDHTLSGGAINYNLTFVPGTLVVTPATLTYKADTKNRSYGDANPVLSGTVTGFVNGEDQTTATTGTLVFATTATTASNIGNYAIDGSGLTANHGNYVFVQDAGNATALTIDPAILTITAKNQSKTYGDTFSFDGSADFTATGLQNGETLGSVDLASGGAIATASVAGGPYAITASNATGGTFDANNYAIDYQNGSLTVTPKALSLSGTRAYDATTGAYGSDFGTVAGIGGDTFTVSGTGTVTSKNVGTYSGADFDLGTLSLTANGAALASNYTLTGGTDTLTITARPITVDAVADNKTYDGTATATVTSLTSGGVLGSDTVSFASTGAAFVDANAANGKTVTVSGITASGADASNYTINTTAITNADITQANATVTANSATLYYNGQPQSVTGFTASGLVNGETESVLTGVTESGGAGTSPGSYAHTLGGADTNYRLTFVDGALVIQAVGDNPFFGTQLGDVWQAALAGVHERQQTAPQAQVTPVHLDISHALAVPAQWTYLPPTSAQLEAQAGHLAQAIPVTLLRFPLNDATPSQSDALRQALQPLAAFLVQHPDVRMTVTGYTDSTGSERLNARLSQQRAQAVVEMLEQLGVAADQLDLVGGGYGKPVGDNDTVEGRDANRRVEMQPTLAGAPI